MPIRDANALRQVRDALWQRPRRGACVIVGSGLSRNHATPIHGEATMPTWSDLACLLSDRLKDSSDLNHTGSCRPPAESGPVLAQKFEAMYGRDALDQFLIKHIPDYRAPHCIHTDLLRLPWADVFTTNWDTFLERASYKIRDAVYEPVFSGADLSTASTPRIVKLHGSFPSHRPFIITEEDYRKYPQSHAPLVNTVQQALMERVVLLLGFSGDDPNFLHWLGWVRDQLGTAAPRLFVGGLLQLDHPRRRLLEDRGVVPIDLVDHPKATTWGSDARLHAVEWILDALSRGERYERDWPDPRPSGVVEKTLRLEPILAADTEGPERETVEVPGTSDAAIRSAAVEDVLKNWKLDRRCYPQWVVLPFSKVGNIQNKTESCTNTVLDSTETWKPVERLRAVYELIWRYDLLMNPHPRKLTEAAEEAIRATNKTLPDRNECSASDSETVFDCRTAISLSLLTEARFRFDDADFTRLATDIEKRNPTWTDFRHKLQQEQCLWALTVQDFGHLETRLKSWLVSDCDPIWMLRKAALYVDSGQHGEAMDLAEQALHQLERQAGRATDVRTMSRLSWALLWRHGKETEKWWTARFSGQSDYPPIFDKWSQFAHYECDAYTDWQQFKRAVLDDRDRYCAAHRVVRMTELAGLPSRISYIGMAKAVLRNAANAMVGLAIEKTLPIAIRAGGSDPATMLSAILTPGQVARLDRKVTARMVQSLERGRDHYLRTLPGPRMEKQILANMACANVEALARLVSRAHPRKGKKLWKWAIRYRGRKHGGVDLRLWKSVENLRKASWDAITSSDRPALFLETVSSPLLEHPPIEDHADPTDILKHDEPSVRTGGYGEGAWAKCVVSLMNALYRGGEVRKRACVRLRWLFTNGLLTDVENLDLSRALWPARVSGHGLPTDTGMHDWMLLDMPEPSPGLAANIFRKKWVLRDIQDDGLRLLAKTLAEVCNACRADVPGHKPLVLSKTEQNFIWDKVDTWLQTRSPSKNYRFGCDDVVERDLITGLAAIIARQGTPRRHMSELYKKVKTLAAPRISTSTQLFFGNEYMLIAAAAGLRTRRAKCAEVLMRTAVRSDDERVRNSALRGLRWWLIEAAKSGTAIRPPSVTCVQEIGIILASRTQAGMEDAMAVAIAAMKSRSEKHIDAVVPLAKEGLRKWWDALQYGRTDIRGTDWDKKIVNRRAWCVRLARALEESGHGDPDMVKECLDAARNDPMVEVRYAAEE